MKIILATPHYPPNHIGGTELIARRYARLFTAQGAQVEVVCIESITAEAGHPFCVSEAAEGITVHRLFYNQQAIPHREGWDFRNPLVADWFREHLARAKPDLVHLLSGYLISGSIAEAAMEQGIPTLVTLLDYWFICPQITLLRTNGQLCADKTVPAARCVWCARSIKRRYRTPDQFTQGRLGDSFTALAQNPVAARIFKAEGEIALIEERRKYLKSILERADAVITHSRFLESRVREYGITPREWVYLPNGIELTAESPVDRPKAVSMPLRIGYLGQIAPHKGVKVLLDAYLALDSAAGQSELHIYGDVKQWPDYSNQLTAAAKNRPDVIWKGTYTAAELRGVLESLDVVVVPSVWFENRPTVIMEAFANGVPVIASHMGGMAEMVEHGVDGLLFEPGSAEDLSRQLRTLIGHPDQVQTWREGIQPVRSAADEFAQLAQLYDRLIANHPAAVDPVQTIQAA